ncbi:MAG: carboxymuconolactone decarboxylase family protein [Gammaproteobacteria bacterium]|jgi:alkylhydroperoxidase/carboxymuconolactone decarboxylase family protein YurZ|nr:carboxymuconolactone decarboxylase family protein [Gammaproteobacteria bacterium]MBU1407677.1 carboxymuconolactone decarboxylase family protein [Gammaproteobacteria bacterium]MBU1531790.1 carboxymuconolactone decarboxylase family protein [Gammaproteobacteria bacterium]
MSKETLPEHYLFEKKAHQAFIDAVEDLGKALRKQGPLDEKTANLIQLAAAIAIHSEGAVHSHIRRAIENGASAEEVYHAIVLLTSTVGFPTVSAALSWAGDIVRKQQERSP